MSKELMDEVQKATKDFQEKNNELLAEVKKTGSASQELKNTVDTLNTRLDELEAKMKAPVLARATDSEIAAIAGNPETKKAYEHFLRKGVLPSDLAPEIKTMLIGNDTTGGYLAPGEYVQEIIKGVVEYSPIRTLARVRQTSNRSIMIPKRTGQPTAYWTAEAAARTTSDSSYGLEELPNHELTAEVRISNQDLEDSVFNLEQEISMDASEQFGVAEGLAFVTGNGTGKPQGFLSHPSIANTVSGDASLLTANGLIAVYYGVKTAYAAKGKWALNRNSLKAIRQLVDGEGRYLWNNGIALGSPPIILERPYVEIPDMPDVASNAFPVAFGDFQRGYLIVDRLDIQTLRDPFSLSSQGLIKFVMRKRVGGQLVLPEAVRLLKIAAS